RSARPEQIARLSIREIEQGIEGTGIRAGVIKVATDAEGVTPGNDVILRAAARACLATGTPISTHTSSRLKTGGEQLRILLDEGADPAKLCIGHSNDTADREYLTGLLRQGVYWGMDHHFLQFAPDVPDWRERTKILAELIREGFGDRIMLGHDWVPLTAWGAPRSAPAEGPPPDGYLMITRKVLPLLRGLGVSEAQVEALMVGNPRRFFGQ
ncbi:MAG: phosphotriesterase-related protein, partial [Chloroflexi bacterium]|nr:phosphotriesterase-related protein [Chloroflexota bacterium]